MTNNNTIEPEPINIKAVLKLILSGIALLIGLIVIILIYYPPQPLYDTSDDYFNLSLPLNDKFKDVPLPSTKGGGWYNTVNDTMNDTMNETSNKSVYDTENATWLYQNGFYGGSSGGQYPVEPIPELKSLCAVLIGVFGIYLIMYKKVD